MVLIVLGAGTLGALPGAQARGHATNPVVDPAAVVAAFPFPVTDPEAAALVGNVVTAPGASVPAAQTAGEQPSLEQRPAQFTTALPDQRAQVAIKTAMSQLGLPYVWGGDGPTNGDAGFDCSGLTTFSYAAAAVALPRTAHTQYYKGPHVPAGAPVQPGDLVFYGSPAKVHHVGMYLGEGKMVNAPTFGKPVQVAFYRWAGDDFLGVTRPAASGETSTGLLPYAPEAPSAGTPETFPAPVAAAPTTTPNATAAQPAESVSAAEASAGAASSVVTSTGAPSTTPAAGATTTTTVPSSSSPVAVTTTPKPSTSTTTTRPNTSTTTTTTSTTPTTPPTTGGSSSPAPPTTPAPTSSAPAVPENIDPATASGGIGS